MVLVSPSDGIGSAAGRVQKSGRWQGGPNDQRQRRHQSTPGYRSRSGSRQSRDDAKTSGCGTIRRATLRAKRCPDWPRFRTNSIHR